MKTFLKWFYALLATGISAAANGVTASIVAPESFNFTHAGWVKIGTLCGVNALLAIALYLKQSPLPGSLTDPGQGGVQSSGTLSTTKPD